MLAEQNPAPSLNKKTQQETQLLPLVLQAQAYYKHSLAAVMVGRETIIQGSTSMVLPCIIMLPHLP